MNKFAARCLAVVACLLALVAVGSTAALADSGTTNDDAQLLDVSKQVTGIQHKLNELLAHGQWARSGKLSAGADCEYGTPSTAFAAWGDNASYALAPQGDLAVTDGWTFNKQALVASGGDPFSGAARSLQLGKGAEAATPAMCVDTNNPSIRFFVRDVGGNGKANIKVDVLYEDLDGHVKHLTVARLKAGDAWQPSLIVPMYMNMLALASPSGVTAVAFDFKVEGLQKDEVVSISSLYVDPFVCR